MRYSECLQIVGENSLFETSLLAAGNVSPYQAQRRLTDWSKAGKVVPLRRGLYALPKGIRVIEPHPLSGSQSVGCGFVCQFGDGVAILQPDSRICRRGNLSDHRTTAGS